MTKLNEIEMLIESELNEAVELRRMFLSLKDEKSALYQLGRENELRQLLRMFEGLR